MTIAPHARQLLTTLQGQQIYTVTGRPNQILRINGTDVIVATSRSPQGTPIPIEWVQDALDKLMESGEIEVSVNSLGYRSAFVGAILLTLPGTVLIHSTPPRIKLS